MLTTGKRISTALEFREPSELKQSASVYTSSRSAITAKWFWHSMWLALSVPLQVSTLRSRSSSNFVLSGQDSKGLLRHSRT